MPYFFLLTILMTPLMAAGAAPKKGGVGVEDLASYCYETGGLRPKDGLELSLLTSGFHVRFCETVFAAAGGAGRGAPSIPATNLEGLLDSDGVFAGSLRNPFVSHDHKSPPPSAMAGEGGAAGGAHAEFRLLGRVDPALSGVSGGRGVDWVARRYREAAVRGAVFDRVIAECLYSKTADSLTSSDPLVTPIALSIPSERDLPGRVEGWRSAVLSLRSYLATIAQSVSRDEVESLSWLSFVDALAFSKKVGVGENCESIQTFMTNFVLTEKTAGLSGNDVARSLRVCDRTPYVLSTASLPMPKTSEDTTRSLDKVVNPSLAVTSGDGLVFYENVSGYVADIASKFERWAGERYETSGGVRSDKGERLFRLDWKLPEQACRLSGLCEDRGAALSPRDLVLKAFDLLSASTDIYAALSLELYLYDVRAGEFRSSRSFSGCPILLSKADWRELALRRAGGREAVYRDFIDIAGEYDRYLYENDVLLRSRAAGEDRVLADYARRAQKKRNLDDATRAAEHVRRNENVPTK